MTRRRSHIHHAAPALVVVGLLASAVAAQSLGDLAKKTAAVKKLPPCSGDTEAVPVVDQTAPPLTPAAAPAPTPAASTSDTKKDEGYWKNRMRTLKAQLKSDHNQLSAASARLAEYLAALARSERTINGEASVDGALKMEVRTTRNEVRRLTARVASDRRQVVELEQEARQAGVPPGWLQ